MDHKYTAYSRNLRSIYVCMVVLGILGTITSVHCLEYRRVSRKLDSSPEPGLDAQFSNEELRQLLSILDSKSKDEPSTKNHETTTERASVMQHNAMIFPELMRIRSAQHSATTTTTPPPMTRVTTRRFYRRLRRKPTTTGTSTEAPSSTTLRAASEVESSRKLPNGASPGDILQQLSLLNGILGALNTTAQAPAQATPESLANANDNATPVPDFLALFTGAKHSGEASSKSEVVVPPPPSSSSPTAAAGGQIDDPAATLALLNLFSNSGTNTPNKDTTDNSNNAAANLLNLVAQSQQAAVQQPAVPSSSSLTGSDADATAAALTKLLLQSSASSAPVIQGNSLTQPQAQHASADTSAAQLNSLLGLLGTLGAAGGQQSQSGNINQLFNLGGDQVAQAQTTNSLAQLFGQQAQSQQAQTQNLLNLLGGNQGNQGFGLSNLLTPQTGNSIPGLGLLSTVSSLGSSIFSTVSNMFGGSRADGKPRVRGKGVDTRVGLGYRLGNIGDAQVVWDIGPQLFTDPLRNEARPYTQKRESGSPSGLHYFQSTSATATEKEVQQIEAKRRMVQAAIQDHYRGDHFASVYPKPSDRRSSSHYDYSTSYNHYYPKPKPSSSTKKSSSTTSSGASSSSLFSSLPFADHIKGFWSGLTSGITGSDNQDSHSQFYNFDDVRSDFSANLIKRSSPDYTDYESRAYRPRKGRDDDIDDPTHSTLTEYERMLLQYGKDIGVVANTQHGVIDDEPQASESGFFSRWFKSPSSSSSPATSRSPSAKHSSEWGMQQPPLREQTKKSVKKSFQQPSPSPSVTASSSPSSPPFGFEGSFHRRNNNRPARRNGPRPQKRRSHNPFRNWIASFKQSSQRSRNSHPAGGFGRRHFKRPSVAGNPQLKHFSNTNQDLMMADANNEFVEPEGVESAYDPGYGQAMPYGHAHEFSDVALTMAVPPRRRRPTSGPPSRASLSQRERVVEPALLYDHLQVSEPTTVASEIDESFSQRNKVVVNSVLREREKLKVLGTSSTAQTPISALDKIQKLRLQNKLRNNATGGIGKQKIIVKIKATKGATPQHLHKSPPVSGKKEPIAESTTALPSVLSTISSIFSATTKPKLLNSLIHNATSIFPSISSIRILPRKNPKKQTQTKLTLQNGKPAVVAIPDSDSDEYDNNDQETAADGEESAPLVQVGHDMSFNELQTLFGSKSNGTKRRRFRIRVKESVLKGDANAKDDKERKDSDEDEEDEEMKDIFVDIESGEVSVLKPVASLVSFNPKKEEASNEEEVDYYEDDDGDGVADEAMKRKEAIFEAIQKELVRNFEKMKRKQQKADAKKRRKEELAEKGMDESMDVVTKYFDLMQNDNRRSDKEETQSNMAKPAVGGLSM